MLWIEDGLRPPQLCLAENMCGMSPSAELSEPPMQLVVAIVRRLVHMHLEAEPALERYHDPWIPWQTCQTAWRGANLNSEVHSEVHSEVQNSKLLGS